MAAFEKMKGDQQRSEVRLREEHNRVQGMQGDFMAEASVLREEIVSGPCVHCSSNSPALHCTAHMARS